MNFSDSRQSHAAFQGVCTAERASPEAESPKPEYHLLPRLVLQEGAHDCGVACLAMAAGVEYQEAKQQFDALGLHAPQKAGGLPYGSNFKDLTNAFAGLGIAVRMRRFIDWKQIVGPSVIKVRSGHKRHWHWVFASRTDVLGLHVVDPSGVDGYMEKMPFGVSGVTLDYFKSYGNFLACDGARKCKESAKRPSALRFTVQGELWGQLA